MKDDLREARSRIRNLKRNLALPPRKPDLDEKEREIRRYLFVLTVDHILSAITADLGFTIPQGAKYYLKKIGRTAFINRPLRRSVVHRFPQYTLKQKGPMELGMIDWDEFVV